MESSLPSQEDECPKIHLTKSHDLELAYKESLRGVAQIIQDESTRRLRLRYLLLEDENGVLQDHLAFDDDRIESLEIEREELKKDLEQAHNEFRRCEGDLRMQTRELNNLRAEITSMNGITTDSAKLLTEKLALTRELATLKPELDHLRCQTVNHQSLLADKLALQQRVTILEVELETERRASEQAVQKHSGNSKKEEMEAKMDEFRMEIMRERKETEKERKAAEKRSSDLEARNLALESKLEQMRTKLQSTKLQLKEVQAELVTSQDQFAKISTGSLNAESSTSDKRKRPAPQISIDATIGTPDGVAIRGRRPAAKRAKIDQTLLGEKSMFSITPFLNRTISVAPETPEIDPQVERNGGEPQQEPQPTDHEELIAQAEKARPPSPQMILNPTKKAGHRQVLKDAKPSATNMKIAPKRQRTMGTLAKVTEEDADENTEPTTATVTQTATDSKKIPEEAEQKKKKRKRLGAPQTVFDEEDGESTKRPAKVKLGHPKLLGRPGLGGPKTAFRGIQGTGFGAFSPLKKDKRGLGASFLA